jgi:hypothetical protein
MLKLVLGQMNDTMAHAWTIGDAPRACQASAKNQVDKEGLTVINFLPMDDPLRG